MHITMLTMRRVAAMAALALSGSAFAAGQDGQTVFKDAATGQLRNPTAAQAKGLNDLRERDRATRRDAESSARAAAGKPPVGAEIIHPNGMVQVVLGEESISYSVMTRNEKGALVLQCVTGADAANNSLSTPVTVQSKQHQHEVQSASKPDRDGCGPGILVRRRHRTSCRHDRHQ